LSAIIAKLRFDHPRAIHPEKMSPVFHDKISMRSIGVRGVVAASRNCFSEDQKFSLAASAKKKDVSGVPS